MTWPWIVVCLVVCLVVGFAAGFLLCVWVADKVMESTGECWQSEERRVCGKPK